MSDRVYERPWERGALRVADNGRYFCVGDTPFFWLADTAWLLFHKLTLEESENYLRNRKELGFNIILADFIHGGDQKNRAGQAALTEDDLARPAADSGFWLHVDQVIAIAERLGLYMGILPVWGSSIVKSGKLNMGNVDAYMDFVLSRYHNASNLIWIVGGDVRGDVAPEVFCRMGQRMKADNPDRLVGYHPFGRTTSAFWFHQEAWLDFNLFQSGHRRYDQKDLGAWDDNNEREGWFGEDNWRYVERDRERIPARPVLDGEPSYEGIPQGLHDSTQPYWQAADVRRYAYWSVLAGAAGHTYGHNSVMQFYGDLSRKGAYGAKSLWTDAVHHPGGSQMAFLKALMESVDYINGRPVQEYLLCEQGEKYDRIQLFGGEDFLIAYTYTGREIRLSLKAYEGKELAAYWMDPVTGRFSFIRKIPGGGDFAVVPPVREDGEDMALLLRAE